MKASQRLEKVGMQVAKMFLLYQFLPGNSFDFSLLHHLSCAFCDEASGHPTRCAYSRRCGCGCPRTPQLRHCLLGLPCTGSFKEKYGQRRTKWNKVQLVSSLNIQNTVHILYYATITMQLYRRIQGFHLNLRDTQFVTWS